MRPVNSMIEFKQIIGRGTRLFDGKDYFTIYDFVKAYEHFQDDEWDGPPSQPNPPTPKGGEDTGNNKPGNGDDGGSQPRERPQKIKIKLADGKERTIQSMMATSFWGADGKPLSAAEFLKNLFGELPELFKNEDELRALWSNPITRKALLESLSDKGYGREQFSEIKRMIDAEKSDLFDVLAYIAFALSPMTRQERVATHKSQIHAHYDANIQEFLDFVLNQYVKEGDDELDQEKLPGLLELQFKAVSDAAVQLGGIAKIREAFVGFQKYLYRQESDTMSS